MRTQYRNPPGSSPPPWVPKDCAVGGSSGRVAMKIAGLPREGSRSFAAHLPGFCSELGRRSLKSTRLGIHMQGLCLQFCKQPAPFCAPCCWE